MTIEDDIFFLEQVTTFAQLGFSALQIIAIGAEKDLESGEVLFEAGDTAASGYVIRHGTLKLALPNAAPSDPGITRAIADKQRVRRRTPSSKLRVSFCAPRIDYRGGRARCRWRCGE